MDTNGNERVAHIDNGVYYNGIANIQITDTTCTFHQVDYQTDSQGYSGILGSTSSSNIEIPQAGKFIITFKKGSWGYTSGGSLKNGDIDLPVQGTYANKIPLVSSAWIKVSNKTYTPSSREGENEADDNDK